MTGITERWRKNENMRNNTTVTKMADYVKEYKEQLGIYVVRMPGGRLANSK
jgi:hypothetical protein